MTLEERIFALLDELGIHYDMLEHQAVYTVAEARACGIDSFAGTSCKNLFLRSGSPAKKNYYLVLAPDAKKVDLKALTAVLGANARLNFAKENELMERLSLHPGAVTPLAIIADGEGAVQLVIDRKLVGQTVHAHPGVNTKTLAIALDDVLSFARHTGHEARLADIPGAEE